METNRKARIALRVGLPLALLTATQAPAADANVQQQFQLREQQQMELQLKMQQQLDRSTRPLGSPADFQARQLDRDQQQRLQQFNDLQTRGMIAPGVVGAPASGEQMRRDLERGRAVGAGGIGVSGGQAGPFSSGRTVETPSAANGP